MTIPGTTGAGKTTAILSLLTNALAQGSGFVLVDGKADRDLFGKVLALARRFGREDDVRVLNFMVASAASRTATRFNPFAIGNADAIRELLASQLGEQAQNDPNGVFRERAVALIGTIAPVLVWLRDHKGVPLNIEVIRFSIELRWIWKLAMEKNVLLRDPETGTVTELDVSSEIPEDITWPLRSYLGELPGYDPTCRSTSRRATSLQAARLTRSSTSPRRSRSSRSRSATSFGWNRRYRHARRGAQPAHPGGQSARAGKLRRHACRTRQAGRRVAARDDGAAARRLAGGRLHAKPTSPAWVPAPFPVVLDELAYYATSGLDRMLAHGARPQHLLHARVSRKSSGIWARLGEKTASLLGNANLTIAMRQQDAGPHPRVDREDRRADLHHAGDHLSRARTTARIARRGTPRCGRSRASTGTT